MHACLDRRVPLHAVLGRELAVHRRVDRNDANDALQHLRGLLPFGYEVLAVPAPLRAGAHTVCEQDPRVQAALHQHTPYARPTNDNAARRRAAAAHRRVELDEHDLVAAARPDEVARHTHARQSPLEHLRLELLRVGLQHPIIRGVHGGREGRRGQRGERREEQSRAHWRRVSLRSVTCQLLFFELFSVTRRESAARAVRGGHRPCALYHRLISCCGHAVGCGRSSFVRCEVADCGE